MEAKSFKLSNNQIQSFEDNGFLILKDFVDSSTCEQLREQANEMVEAFEPDEVISIFSTKNQTNTTDQYFMESGDKIRFFFEEDAFDQSGELKQAKAQSINKIGHALHELNPLFKEFSFSPKIGAISKALGLQTPLPVQSMYIFKQPHIGGAVQCHQDSTFLYTSPMSVIGFWFALEEATQENGCLWALPGQHNAGIKSRFLRSGNYETTFETYDSTAWSTDDLVPLEVTEGTMIILHGSLPHMSYPNRSPKSRHAYSLHVIDGNCEYPASNWLQRPTNMPFQEF